MLYKNNFIHPGKLYEEFEKKMYVRNLNVSSLFITHSYVCLSRMILLLKIVIAIMG